MFCLPCGGAESRARAGPCFCSKLFKSGSWVFQSCIFWVLNLPQLLMHAVMNFSVFCCMRRRVSRHMHCGEGSQVPGLSQQKSPSGPCISRLLPQWKGERSITGADQEDLAAAVGSGLRPNIPQKGNCSSQREVKRVLRQEKDLGLSQKSESQNPEKEVKGGQNL